MASKSTAPPILVIRAFPKARKDEKDEEEEKVVRN
jgi:hypothetical protein